MAGQEYTGKDKIVQKMSRDGLTEENLHEGTSKRNKKYQNTKDLIREPPSRAAPSEEPFTEEESVIEKKISRNNSSYRKKLHAHEGLPKEESLESKEAIQKKRQRKRLTEEQKKVSKLSFDDEGGMIAGAGTSFGKKAAGIGGAAVGAYVHEKLHHAEDDNAGLEGAHASEIAVEEATRSLRSAQIRMNRTSGRLAKKGYRDTESPTSGRLKFEEMEKSVREAAKETVKKKERNRLVQPLTT